MNSLGYPKANMYIQNTMARYKRNTLFINQIEGGYPIVDSNGYFMLNDNNEQMIGIAINGMFEIGHQRSRKTSIFIAKRQLLELRGILDAAIFDLYEGQDMSSMFSDDLK